MKIWAAEPTLGSMKPFPDPLPNQFLLAPAAERMPAAVLDLIARLALNAPLRVLDGGNCINIYPLARQLRRRTAALTESLRNVRLARAFTCYQMLTLLANSPAEPVPTLVLDILDTYYDESVPLWESQRLLELSIHHLQRLRQSAPLVVTARPPRAAAAQRQPLFDALLAAADGLV